MSKQQMQKDIKELDEKFEKSEKENKPKKERLAVKILRYSILGLLVALLIFLMVMGFLRK